MQFSDRLEAYPTVPLQTCTGWKRWKPILRFRCRRDRLEALEALEAYPTVPLQT